MPPARRPPMTAALRAVPGVAIVDRIWEVDGVEKIYYEDLAHALALQKQYYPEDAGMPLESMNEAFHVKVAGPGAAMLVLEKVGRMPGVESSWRYDVE